MEMDLEIIKFGVSCSNINACVKQKFIT